MYHTGGVLIFFKNHGRLEPGYMLLYYRVAERFKSRIDKGVHGESKIPLMQRETQVEVGGLGSNSECEEFSEKK